MTVGVMIGSGIFLLPAVLAPYGSISFLGWLATTVGAVTVSLVLARLASRTTLSGGFYVYTRAAFGDLAGFLVAWSYWLSLLFGIAAISVAFAGYAGAIVPAVGSNALLQALVAVSILWGLTAVNIFGVARATSVQLVMTLLKIVPLLVVIGLGVHSGSQGNVPPFNPLKLPAIEAVAATALLTMWAFVGLEAGLIPAEEVRNARRTVPRAVVIGTLCVSAVYIASTAAVMTLVPADVLAQSEAPFAQAASALGSVGGPLIALGALVSTAGSLNGNILLSGQMPMAVARDGLLPRRLAATNDGRAPTRALVLSSTLATALLMLSFSEGLVATFTFLISISTLAVLLPYAVSSIAELRHSALSTPAWAVLAIVALGYLLVAIAGAGIETLSWGALLFCSGIPVYLLGQRTIKSNRPDSQQERAT